MSIVASPAPEPDKLLVSAADAARILALSPRTLHLLTAAGEIPVVRAGRSVRYDRRDLVAWIDRAKHREGGDHG